MCTPKAQLDLARKCKAGSHHAGGVGCSESHCPNSNLSKQIAAPSKKPDAAIAISLKCFITPPTGSDVLIVYYISCSADAL